MTHFATPALTATPWTFLTPFSYPRTNAPNINRISSITCSRELQNLISIDLELNKLKLIPVSLYGLKKLEYLNMSRNQIEKITKEIAGLKKLTLELGSNSGVVIDKEAGDLDQIVNTAKDLAPCLAPKHGQLCITTIPNGQSTP